MAHAWIKEAGLANLGGNDDLSRPLWSEDPGQGSWKLWCTRCQHPTNSKEAFTTSLHFTLRDEGFAITPQILRFFEAFLFRAFCVPYKHGHRDIL